MSFRNCAIESVIQSCKIINQMMVEDSCNIIIIVTAEAIYSWELGSGGSDGSGLLAEKLR